MTMIFGGLLRLEVARWTHSSHGQHQEITTLDTAPLGTLAHGHWLLLAQQLKCVPATSLRMLGMRHLLEREPSESFKRLTRPQVYALALSSSTFFEMISLFFLRASITLDKIG